MDNRPNFNPKAWGPPAWVFLDTVLASYPVNAMVHDQLWMIDFLTVLGHALPCDRCRTNFNEFRRLYPIVNHVGGRAEVQRWLKSYKQWSLQR